MRFMRLAMLWGMVLGARAVAAQATVVGVVFDSLVTRGPLKGATVVIPELARYAPTDEHGRFQFDTVPAGKYTMTFLHRNLDSLDVSAEILPITIPASGIVNARLAMPSPAGFVSLVCGAAADTFPAMIVGRVRDATDSTAVAGALVVAEWDRILLRDDMVQRRVVRATAHTTASGGYVLCGVPNDMRLSVSVTAGTHKTGNLDLLLEGRVLVRHDLAISRSDSAAATISGVVRDAKGRPAAQATVLVLGTGLRVKTDAGGNYSIARVPGGTHPVEVRRPGNWPTLTNVDVPGRGTKAVDLPLGPGHDSPQAVRTDSPDSPDSPDSIDVTGFTDRSQSGIGTFASAATIAAQPTASLADILSKLYPMAAAGRTRLSLNLGENAMTKLMKMAPSGSSVCTPNYFLNGVPWLPTIRGRAQMEIESTIDTRLITGIEVYEPHTIPPQFDRRDKCGSVVIWVGAAK